MRQPALILSAVLMRPVDAAHAENSGREPIAAGIVEYVLIGRAFRAAVGAVELQRAALGDAAARQLTARHIAASGCRQVDVVDRAVYLVRRGEDQPRIGAVSAQRLQQIERAAGIDGKVLFRIFEARRHRDLSGEMKHGAGLGKRRAQPRAVAQIGHFDLQAGAVLRQQPPQIRFRSGPRETVQDAHPAPLAQQPVGQISADKTRAAGDQRRLARSPSTRLCSRQSHSVKPRDASAARASPTRSTATRPSSQRTSFCRPAASVVRGR